jgi:hypothetical protein
VTTLSALWGKLRKAQAAKNADASNAYREAITRADKGKDKDAEWWEKQGDDAMNDGALKEVPEEHVTR